jgi:hypothetical protein
MQTLYKPIYDGTLNGNGHVPLCEGGVQTQGKKGGDEMSWTYEASFHSGRIELNHHRLIDF